MASEKRARFQSPWLPYALILPQLAITLVFFFWPAGQALFQSVLVQDAFGATTQFVWLDNFRELFHDENYLASFKVTAIFSVLVAGIGLAVSLVLAAFADRVVRGATFYKTLLIVPYAVAPAIAAVLWLFLFNPTLGIVAHWLRALHVSWDPLLDGTDALIMVVTAAVWKQISYNFLFFLAGLQSIPKSLLEAAAIDGAGPVIAAVLWLFLFNPPLGIVAHWLRALHVSWDPLLDGTDALIMVVTAAVWKQISYNFLFFLAGLQSIPKSLLEAAAIDGAGPV